ncbi:hypothetical protein ACP70R_008484 [Stipagrostis hirtigluma subsp. patula]
MADDNGFDLLEGCIGFVWNCVQFWTTLSAATILICIIYRPQHFHPHVNSSTSPPPRPTPRITGASGTTWRPTSASATGTAASTSGTRTSPPPHFTAAPGLAPPTTRSRRPSPRDPRTVLHPVFEGTATVDSSIAAELEGELAAGTVHVRVTLSLTLRYKIGFSQDIAFHQYDCWLWFPLPLDGAPAIFDAGTRCWEAK